MIFNVKGQNTGNNCLVDTRRSLFLLKILSSPTTSFWLFPSLRIRSPDAVQDARSSYSPITAAQVVSASPTSSAYQVTRNLDRFQCNNVINSYKSLFTPKVLINKKKLLNKMNNAGRMLLLLPPWIPYNDAA